MLKKIIYSVTLFIFVALIGFILYIQYGGGVAKVEKEVKKVIATNITNLSPKYVSGISALVTPEQVSLVTREEKRESCSVTQSTVMTTISTSSKPVSGDVVVVLYKDGFEQKPTAIILHRGIKLDEFMGNGSKGVLNDTPVITGTVTSYSGSMIGITLPDGSIKDVNTSHLPLFILNAKGLPQTINPTDRVDMNCEYNKGKWEAKSVTVFN